MTLFRQLIMAILALFLILYSINIFVSLNNSRILVEDQMRVHAQDTATSLGLTMTQAAAENDTATLETLFNAVTDSGFFQRIYFSNMNGEIEIDRHFPINIESVPDWFIQLVEFPAFEGKAQVSSGWAQLGELTVLSHPAQAYLRLWQTTIAQLLWFALVTFVACLLAYSALRWLMTPLQAVEAQADAVGGGDFQVQEVIPKTRELKSVVMAMNRMSEKLKKLFTDQLDLITKLRKLSATDPVTGLPNRSDFDARLEGYVKMETGTHPGVLMIISVGDMHEINRLSGRTEGNNILQMVTQQFYQALGNYPKSVVARRQGVEFCVFVPDVDTQEADKLALAVFSGISSITWQHEDKCPLAFHLGYVYQAMIEDVAELLSAADMALKKAQQSGKNLVQNYADIHDAEVPVLSSPAEDLQEFLQRTVDDNTLNLYYQPICTPDSKEVVANEVYARFPSGDQLFSAGAILPVAERLGFMPTLDKMMLEKLIIQAQGGFGGSIRINISAYTLRSENFHDWFDSLLAQNKGFAQGLVVEMAEYAVRVNQQAVVALNKILIKHSAGFCIDHFGLETSSFPYLGSLKLHSLKVHRSFVKDLEENKDNQFYIKALANLAHNMDLQLFVEGVETEAQWRILSQLNVDACQGYYLGEPVENPVT